MGKIFYSVAGEGRGHATRVKTVVEELKSQHDVVLFAPHVAFDFLSQIYQWDARVEVRKIPGLQFCYSGRRVSYLQSVTKSIPYLRELSQLVNQFELAIRQEQPDLMITDFEPALPRAAKRLGLPFVSFDHQHFLTAFDLSTLPWPLWLKAQSIAASINLFYCGQQETIVSSFFSLPLRKRCKNVTSVGVLLRRDLMLASPRDEQHLLVYLRRFAPPRLMAALRACGRDVFIYGLGDQPRDGNLCFFDVDESGFIDDLVNCHALITNSGNQLVGEALSLRKPVLVMPEEGNFEQAVNAHFLTKTGCGIGYDARSFTTDDLSNFLEQVPELRLRINPDSVVGNGRAFEAIRRYLPPPVSRPAEVAEVTGLAEIARLTRVG